MPAKPPTEAEAQPAPNLTAVVKQLGERRKRLDALDDRLADTIKVVESVLRDHVSVRVSKVIWADSYDSSYEQLSFTKLNGKWVLAVESGTATQNGDEQIDQATPLRDCSREKRSQMFAAGHVEGLLHDALDQVNEEIAKREEALIVADRLHKSLAVFAKQGVDNDDDDGSPF
jgi:hypothetical protein